MGKRNVRIGAGACSAFDAYGSAISLPSIQSNKMLINY